ncbi:major facilitator superfamily domain-containing protein [Aspergillus alliaceus]|uniref:major facilitator superfamily domain-containing protein n=1 Tax=Petromyces alliaceus TaxID=209559 RepID=UPI0012A5907F|nr:major facilitator superfamily domain-containing protein [Aspergillus alliaceus]KAB8230982.1 major facilitator superfamily domain-containing protein [Aspergillus alliaceus]
MPMSEQNDVEKVPELSYSAVYIGKLTYPLCYLDRFNIVLMIFLVACSVFEAPSNLAMKVSSSPVWLAFLVTSFGSLCAGIGGAKNVPTLMALRLLLGAVEAGVYPGMIFFLSFWYGPRERAIRIAVFLCSATLAGAFGGAIAYGVGHMNQVGDLPAWRWLFILEGAPCILLAISILLFLPSYPEKAKVHYISYLCIGIGVSSLSFFAPTIVAGIGYIGLDAQLFVIPPYACVYVVTLGAAYMSDRYKNRGLVAAGFCGTGLLTFLIQACVSSPSLRLRYSMLVISTCSVFACLPSFCALASDNVHTTTALSLATALNIAFTGPGQIMGVWIYKSKQAPRYELGHAINPASLFLRMVFVERLMQLLQFEGNFLYQSARQYG